MSVISRYEIDKFVEIFKNDLDFQAIVVKEGEVKSLNLQHPLTSLENTEFTYRELVRLLLLNREIISEYSINEIKENNFTINEFLDLEENIVSAGDFRSEMSEVLQVSFIKSKAYTQILYTFKYSTIKTFFRDNWENFVPDFDVLNISKSEQLTVFQEAFMREFDRFSEIIDEIYNLQDIDRTPSRYLNYLAQTIGYEREDENFLFDASFRELIKNIIEIYRIKGTNFSFELFFNFLGFEANVREFWFDARFFDPLITGNPFTGISSRSNFGFYLTTIRPTDYIPSGMRNPVVVSDDEIGPTLDGSEFNSMISTGMYTPSQLLGLEPGYKDEPYRYFKTNIMEFTLERVSRAIEIDTGDIIEEEEEGGEGEEGGLSAEELQIIRLYANFLTPIFLSRNIVVITRPFETRLTEMLTLSDGTGVDVEPKTDPRAAALRDRYNTEYLFHNYVGAQPRFYYWDDGQRFYKDPLEDYSPGDPREMHFGNRIKPGGNFISGYYNNTYDEFYNPDIPGSVYSKLQTENPLWTQEEILTEISNNISTKEISVISNITEGSPELVITNGFSSLKEGQKIKDKNISLSFFGTFTENSNTIEITGGDLTLIKEGFLIPEVYFTTALGERRKVIENSVVTNVDEVNQTLEINNNAIRDRINIEFFPYLFIVSESRILSLNEGTQTITLDKNVRASYDGLELEVEANVFLENWLFERDLQYPLIDKEVGFINPFISFEKRDFFGNGTKRHFFNATKPKKYNEEPGKFTYAQDAETFPSLYNRGKIKQIVSNNGSGNGEIYILDSASRFSNFDNFGRTEFVDNLFGYLEKGSKIIRNIEYDKNFAPAYVFGQSYVIGDYVRSGTEELEDFQVVVFRCIKDHTAADASPATTEGTNWVRVRGIYNIKRGMRLKVPGSLFEFEVRKINPDRSIEISDVSPKTEEEVSFTFYTLVNNFIEIKHSIHYNNDKVYKVINSEPAMIDGYRCTKLTARTTIPENQNNSGGFVSIFFSERKYEEAYPFMYNTLEMAWEQTGFSERHEFFDASKINLSLNEDSHTNFVPYIIKTSGELVEGSNEIVLTTNNLIDIKVGYRLIPILNFIEEDTFITGIDYVENKIILDKNILGSSVDKKFMIRAYSNGTPLNKGITYYMTKTNQYFFGDRDEVYHRGFPFTTVLEEYILPNERLSFIEWQFEDPNPTFIGYTQNFENKALATGNTMLMSKIYFIDEEEKTIRNSEKIYNSYRDENLLDYIDIKVESA